MKKKFKYLLVILIIIFIPKITYTIDSALVHSDKDPIFVTKKSVYKDGGTIEYRGLGYQIMKWNRLIDNGSEYGYEIYKYPNYRDYNEGPTTKLKTLK